MRSRKSRNGKSAMPMRTCLVMILAGVYVAYLGVSLCQNVINGAEGSSPGFMVAGVIFIVLGVAFVINGIRGSIKAGKIREGVRMQKVKRQASETETSRTVESENGKYFILE